MFQNLPDYLAEFFEIWQKIKSENFVGGTISINALMTFDGPLMKRLKKKPVDGFQISKPINGLTADKTKKSLIKQNNR